MIKLKVFLGITILVLLVMLPIGCGNPTMPESPEDARDIVLSYLYENINRDAPASGIAWERRDVTPEGRVGQTTIEFYTSSYWKVTVSYPLVAPQNIVYDILVTDHGTGWHWQGEVRPDGSITETGQNKPIGTLTAADLLGKPTYDTEVKIWGRVDGLGEVQCTCFFLISGRDSVQVWYDTMVENDGTVKPAVSVKGIRNGDKVAVTGELKDEGGTHYSKDDFWASIINVLPSSQIEALEDSTWLLQSYGEQGKLQAIIKDSEITATFNSAESEVSGSAGCNRYWARYEMEDKKLSIFEMTFTEMACVEPEGILEQEDQYLKIIEAVETYEIVGGKLQLTAGNQILVYEASE